MSSRGEVYARLNEQAKKLVMLAYAEGLTIGEAVDATRLERAFVARIYNTLVNDAVKEAHQIKRQILSVQLGSHMKGSAA